MGSKPDSVDLACSKQVSIIQCKWKKPYVLQEFEISNYKINVSDILVTKTSLTLHIGTAFHFLSMKQLFLFF